MLTQQSLVQAMTEEERRLWEREHPKDVQVDPKKKWRFLQKYWHKGAYFQAGTDSTYTGDRRDEIFGRDYSAPTGEDKLDKTVLPKVRVCARMRLCARRRAHVHACMCVVEDGGMEGEGD